MEICSRLSKRSALCCLTTAPHHLSMELIAKILSLLARCRPVHDAAYEERRRWAAASLLEAPQWRVDRFSAAWAQSVLASREQRPKPHAPGGTVPQGSPHPTSTADEA